MAADLLPTWTWLAPLGGRALMAASTAVSHPTLSVALGAGLVACVIAQVLFAQGAARPAPSPSREGRSR